MSDLKNRAARPTQSDVRHIWEERYQVPREPSSYEDDWFERWSDTLAFVQGGQVLDAGCGPGGDTLRLMNHGLRVVGLDFSLGALKIARGHTRCPVVQSDVCDGIPFRSATFHLIVASLVLHYFNHDTTKSILRALRDCLVPGGRILMRLNSTDDVQFGAEGNPLVEPDVHLVGGVPKRFYNRERVEQLLGEGWCVLEASERSSDRYSRTKRLWEICAERADAHPSLR